MRLVATILLLVLAPAARLGADDATKGTTFTDPDGEFSVVAPETWKQGKVDGGLRVMGPPPAGTKAYPMFQIVRARRRDAGAPVKTAPPGALDGVAKGFAARFTAQGATDLTLSAATLDGIDARQIKFTMPVGEKTVAFDYVLAIRNDRLYYAQFMQELAHYDVGACQAVMGSFRWISK